MKKYTISANYLDKQEKWYVVDADGHTLGRLASQIAHRLRGKHNPMFTPHVDLGDSIIVINAHKIQMTGNKWDQKMYYRHSGYTGGIKQTVAKDMLKRKPEHIIMHAVKGMLPKNRIGRKLLKRLRVYAADSHPHLAQQPEPMNVLQ